MTRIVISGETLDLAESFSLSIEETSPIFNDMGSQSIDVAVPATAHNKRILGFPARVDNADGQVAGINCMVTSRAYVRTGTINIGDASDTEISLNIGFENSIAYEKWKSKKLRDIESLPVYRYRDINALKTHMLGLYDYSHPQNDELAIFPICLAKKTWKDESKEDAEEVTDYWTLNQLSDSTFNENWSHAYRCIDGKARITGFPPGYKCSPFVRVWKILESIFQDLGVVIDKNPFKSDIALARLVVLNNTEDTVCDLTLDYAELMPDCSIEEFLNALHVRFGFVYSIDFDSGMAHVALLREIANLSPEIVLDKYITRQPQTEYVTPQYVGLSAGTSIEGAETAADRFEDFIGDYPLTDVYKVGEEMRYSEAFEEEIAKRLKAITERDKATGSATTDTMDFPEGVDRIPATRTKHTFTKSYLYSWAAATGTWERFCNDYGKQLTEDSSSFFNWDPQPEGFDKNDFTSVDEFCPIRGIDTEEFQYAVLKLENSFQKLTYMPMLMSAPRHFHKSMYHGDEEVEGECPLCFMFAFSRTQWSSKTVGRNSPDRGEDEDGLTIWGPANESQHPYSLYFQFSNGLYAKFWKNYDLIMRRCDRRINVTARISKVMARQINTLKPVMLQGMPMLIDTADITLGDEDNATVEFNLIPILPPEEMKNPEIPDFP